MMPTDDRIAAAITQIVRRPLSGIRSAITAAVGDWNSSNGAGIFDGDGHDGFSLT